MNTTRLKLLSQKQSYHILPIRSGMQLELHERVGEGTNQRIWKMKGLVLKVKRPNHVDGTFTIRGKTSGLTIEKIYPLSFPAFDKVLLLDTFKIRRAKLYYLRDKVGKDARLKSLITADERGMDLLQLAKESVAVQEEILGNSETSEEVVAVANVTEEVVQEEVAVTAVVEEVTTEEVAQETQESVVEESIETPVVESFMVSSEEVVAEEVSSEVVEEVSPTIESTHEGDIIDIDGIGPKFKERLAGFGIHSFKDLANLTDERIAEIEQEDAMTSLEEWHNWIDQAKARVA